jgi:putative ABC transport system permease protein
MSWLQRLFRGRVASDADLDEEIRFHLAEEARLRTDRGERPEEARRRARRDFGSTTAVHQQFDQLNPIGLMESAWRDLKYGARLLRLNPGFALVAILSLALGIGANTAIFQLIDAVRLRTLPVKNPQQLFEVRVANNNHDRSGSFTGPHPMLTNLLWEHIRDGQRGFSSVFAWGKADFELASGGESRPARGLWAGGDFFPTLGVSPVLGRLFTRADDYRGCSSPGAVLSYEFWQRQYGGDAGVIGRSIRLDGHPLPIVGVSPAAFFGVEVGSSFDVAVPLCAEPTIRGLRSKLDRRSDWWLGVMGRLRPGWTIEQASAQLGAISPGIFAATVSPTYIPRSAKKYLQFRLAAFPAGTGVSNLRRSYETPLWLLLATAGLVLLIACANLTNLMLARATAREREIAVRLAIGASRLRIVRQFVAESLLLATCGAGLGIVLAQTLSQFLVSFLGDAVVVDLAAGWRVLGFTTALAVAACLLFGLTPAMRATRAAPGSVLKSSSRGTTDSRERFGLRRGLVVAQVALSLVLVVGALLFVRTLQNLMTVDLGFRDDGVLVTDLDLRGAGISEERQMAFQYDLLERIRRIHGVLAAASVFIVPISESGWNETILVDGVVQQQYPNLNQVSSEFFRTLGTTILAGRDFNDNDTLSSPPVAIVNQSFARAFFGTRDPLGRTFQIEAAPGEPRPTYQIAGLVADTKYRDLRADFGPIAFFAASQDRERDASQTIVIRSAEAMAGLSVSVKRVVSDANPRVLVTFHTLKSQIHDSLLREQLMAMLSGFFGALAGLLATIGLYGVMSYMVARRRNEIGIRMALGATRRDVIGMVMREATVLLAAGVIIGLVMAVVAARATAALLFGVQPGDPATLVAAAAALAAVAMLASYVPALRASRLEPTAALREE